MSSNPAQTPEQSSQQGTRQTPVNYRTRHGSGTSIPPYPLIGEAFIEFATAQQEAARTHAYLVEHHNMEVDAFGFARFHQGPEPAEDQEEVATRNDSIEAAQAPPKSPSLASFHVSSDEGDAQHEDRDGTHAQPLIPYQPGRSIISEENPEFRGVALRLDAYRKSSGLAALPPSQPQRRKPFRPSHMALEQQGLISPPRGDSKYLGHKFKEERSPVPDALNCGLWLSYLHPMTTEEDLFSVIRSGAVYALNITPPQNGYRTAAASVYFMTHSGAERFLAQVNSHQGILVHQLRIKAIYNKHGQEQQSDDKRTRVLRIRGPAQEMTREFWEKYFGECVAFKLSHVYQRRRNDGQVDMEFGFARIDGQAYSVKLAIEAEGKFHGIFQVEYGSDPCDPFADRN